MNVRQSILATEPSTNPVNSGLTLRQQEYLENLMARYSKRTATSKRLTQRYRSVLADSRNASGFNLLLKEIYYPLVGERSLGSKIWDVDGNEYIDLTMGFGINLFGHNPPFIKEAIAQQLEKGIQLGPQAELAGEVAQLISDLTGMERVTFSNTGTEAVMAALRLARATSDRQQIVMFSGSYHGHFDGTLGKAETVDGNILSVPKFPGILPNFVKDVLVLDYGEPKSLEIIRDRARDLAAVLVEPVQSNRPDLQPKSFLHQLRQLTQEAGIALIFDEMVTGFRIHPGGAQGWFGVEADMATYGKIVGGGLPIGVIAGKAAYLDKIDGGWWQYGDLSSPQTETTFFAGTYCKHPLTMAATRAVLTHLKEQGINLQQQLNQRTSQFVEALNAYFEADGVPIRMTHFGSLFGSTFSPVSTASATPAAVLGISLLSYHLLDRGILLRGGSGFLSTAHTDEDLDKVLEAVKDSIKELREGGFLA